MMRTTLYIEVPTENEASPMVAEQIFSSIHSLVEDCGIRRRLFGFKQERISFEIASGAFGIKFYVNVREKYKNLIEAQIYAQYPRAEISECSDYAQNCKAEVYGMDLRLGNSEIYPVKRFVQFEDKKSKYPVDPLASISSVFSKMPEPKDQLWLQIVVSPLEEKWRQIMTKCIKIMIKKYKNNAGIFKSIYARMFCLRNRLVRLALFPIYGLFIFQGLYIDDGSEELRDYKEQLSMTHDKESPLNGALDKVGRLLFEVNIRAVYISKNMDSNKADVKMKEVLGAFKQFSLPQMNWFISSPLIRCRKLIEQFSRREIRNAYVLNTEELATIFHLPTITVNTPGIQWVKARKMEPPRDLPLDNNEDGDGTLKILGKTNFRGSLNVFGIKRGDARRHIYIIGKTGMGKSVLLENMIYSDLKNGSGLAVVDPHGDLAERIIDYIPSNRINDVIVFDPSDRDFPIAFNMLQSDDPLMNSIVCSGIIGIFKKIYANSWGPRLEHILRNTIMTLLEHGNVTFLSITKMLQDQKYRQQIIKKVNDPVLRGFWLDEFEKMDQRLRTEAVAPILNKVGQFLSVPLMRNILGQIKSSVDLRYIMDNKKIAIFNLSKGKIGEDSSSLLGAMIITKFQLDAMSRANIPESEREDFYLYVDEFQNFATESFANILSEARKYRLNMVIANQYVAQVPEAVRDAIFGNVGTMLSFQVGFDDAKYLSGVFGEEVSEKDLIYLPKYSAYLKLLIDGMPSRTFSLATLPPPALDIEEGRTAKVIGQSRERYSNSKIDVENRIMKWSLNNIHN